MANEIKMPQLGLTMTEGTVGTWHKKVGDTVKVGEVLVEIQTDKISTELESEHDGVLLAIIGNEGDEIPVQGLLCVIGSAGEKYEAAAPAASAVQVDTPAAAPTAPAAHAVAVAPNSGTGRVKISPLAKKIAAANDVDYANIAGSGPGGRIVQRDILAALQTSPVVGAPTACYGTCSGSRREKMSPMRKVVAERMFKSHSEIPVVTQTIKVNVTALMEFRSKINANRETRFSVNDLVLKAIAKALSSHPEMLTSIDGNEIVYHEAVNIGMAVALDDGLIVPVIKGADKMSLEAISAAARDLAGRARNGGLAVDEYQGSTFSVSNLGMFGIESFTPIINQPDAAIMGICSIEDELALLDGELVNHKVMRLSLTYDHRLLDGAGAAKFQLTVRQLLENPLDIIL